MYEKLRSRIDHKDDSGFTLIELLMVIVILAVLAAVVVFSVGGLNDTSKSSACKSELSTVNTAAEAYYAQNKASGGAATIGALVTAGFLHANDSITTGTGTSFTMNSTTFTFTPGTSSTAGSLDATCP